MLASDCGLLLGMRSIARVLNIARAVLSSHCLIIDIIRHQTLSSTLPHSPLTHSQLARSLPVFYGPGLVWRRHLRHATTLNIIVVRMRKSIRAQRRWSESNLVFISRPRPGLICTHLTFTGSSDRNSSNCDAMQRLNIERMKMLHY